MRIPFVPESWTEAYYYYTLLFKIRISAISSQAYVILEKAIMKRLEVFGANMIDKLYYHYQQGGIPPRGADDLVSVGASSPVLPVDFYMEVAYKIKRENLRKNWLSLFLTVEFDIGETNFSPGYDDGPFEIRATPCQFPFSLTLIVSPTSAPIGGAE